MKLMAAQITVRCPVMSARSQQKTSFLETSASSTSTAHRQPSSAPTKYALPSTASYRSYQSSFLSSSVAMPTYSSYS
ncbi:hypothetical protein DPMN_116546 [Dreissena polymorpha]|uniref:Uncharacterized protein n=1 Tax=Dreissena polymorpha TaxID=45954 RepID=A0A9D4KP09_DREPO|nr:hypothetical protein DPMN_116546 [Dreissena polymorpha]